MNNDEFKTRELSLAALLIINGIKYLGVEILAPQTYRFLFENPQKCYDLEEKFLVVKKELLDQAQQKEHEKK